jgi:uncharacterized protein (TIGR02646 family)
MRHLKRLPLTKPTEVSLAALTTEVTTASDPKAKAKSRWDSKPAAPFTEVREKLEAMAPGIARCMYCEDSLGTDIDHFAPKADYPALAFSWPNYLLACSYCNSNLKRNQFPLDTAGQPLLIDPTVDQPTAHLLFVSATGEFFDLSPKGAASIRVFGLNDTKPPRRLPRARQHALVKLEALLHRYDDAVTSNPTKAQTIREAICEHPFSAVLVWLLATAQLPGAAHVLDPKLLSILQHHNVASWL